MTAFVQAKWFTPTYGRALDLIVAHDMEYPERPTAAEDCAAYFATTTNKASAHVSHDNNSSVESVLDKDIAFAAPRINHNGLHMEHAGYARQTRGDWLDSYSLPMLEVSARWAAGRARTYSIPIVYVDENGLRTGQRGFTDHRTSTFAFGIQGGHTDPGDNFPWDVYLDMVRAYHTPLPPPRGDDDMPTPEETAQMLSLMGSIERTNRLILDQLRGIGHTGAERTIRHVANDQLTSLKAIESS